MPGGRVRKNETLDDAFYSFWCARACIESGITRADTKFLGVFEHFYDDCAFGGDIITHYIVLGYEYVIDLGCEILIKRSFNLEFKYFKYC